MRATPPTCQDIPLADRRDGPRRMRPPMLQPADHLALGLAASFCGCAGAAQPPAVSPKPLAARATRPPPRQAGSLLAGCHEAAAPAQPLILIQAVTLVLGTRVTLGRGSPPRAGAERATAAAEGDIDPPSGAAVMDAGGQFVTPRLFDAHSHLGDHPTPGAAAHLDGSEREPEMGPVGPQAQSADAFWPQDPGIERAVAGGVTTIQVLSGSGNLIRWCAVTMELRPGIGPSQMLPRWSPDARHRGARRAESGLRGEPEAQLRRGQAGTVARPGQPRSPAGGLSQGQEAPDGLGAMARRGVAPDCDRGEDAAAREATKQERATPQTSSCEDLAARSTGRSRARLAPSRAR